MLSASAKWYVVRCVSYQIRRKNSDFAFFNVSAYSSKERPGRKQMNKNRSICITTVSFVQYRYLINRYLGT